VTKTSLPPYPSDSTLRLANTLTRLVASPLSMSLSNGITPLMLSELVVLLNTFFVFFPRHAITVTIYLSSGHCPILDNKPPYLRSSLPGVTRYAPPTMTLSRLGTWHLDHPTPLYSF